MRDLEDTFTGQEITDLLGIVVTEVVGRLSPSSKVADDWLEDIAGTFLDLSLSLPSDSGVAVLLKGLAGYLIQTEEGSRHE